MIKLKEKTGCQYNRQSFENSVNKAEPSNYTSKKQKKETGSIQGPFLKPVVEFIEKEVSENWEVYV